MRQESKNQNLNAEPMPEREEHVKVILTKRSSGSLSAKNAKLRRVDTLLLCET